MARFMLDRRAVLRGAPGVAIALPFLEVMREGKARAAATPSPKFVLVYAGISLTSAQPAPEPKNKFLTPSKAGPGYDLPPDLSPLGRTARQGLVRTFAGHDIQDDVSIVSGCRIPWSAKKGDEGGVAPPDGRIANFHGHTLAPLLSGTACNNYAETWLGPSAENVVGATNSKNLRFKAIQLQVQPMSYEPGAEYRGRMSFDTDSNGRVHEKSFTASPRAAWKAIFGGAPLPVADLTEEQKQALRDAQKTIIRRNKSVLDVVLNSAERLKRRVGTHDRARLERHFDEIRDLEVLLTQIPDLKLTPYCKDPGDPGADPAADPKLTDPGAVTRGWSDEDKRGKAMRGLMHMALTCDLTRAGFLLISYAQTYINAQLVAGVNDNMHGWSHGHSGSTEVYGDIVAWHVEQFAALARLLKDTPDVDGTSSMLDHTVMLMGTEGGFGQDPEAGPPGPNNDWSSHSSDNMSILVAGGRRLGLKPGQHIPKGSAAHPAAVLRTGMKAVGVDRPLGVVNATIPELLA